MRRFLVAVLALALMPLAAHADGLPYRGSKVVAPDEGIPSEINWSGLYLGAGVGGQWAITSLGMQSEDSSAGLNNLGSQDWIINGRIGLDMRMPSTPFIFGVFADYSGGDSTASFNVGDTTMASLTLRPTWGVGGRVGWLLNPAIMGYIGYKYSRADLDVNIIGGTCNLQGFNCSQELVGHSALAGVEWKMAKQLTGAVEYAYTRYDSATIFSDDVSKITAQPDGHTVMFRLNWRPFGNN